MTPHVSITLLRTQTDERLIELIAAGHDRAFDAVVDRYRRPLLRYARRFLPEETRAEDVVQAAFVSAWGALRDGAPVRDLRPWLYRIVHNGALNVMKKPGGDDAQLIEASDLRPGPATEVEQREDVRQALDTIAALPDRQRAALLAVALDGRSHADVGEELGINDTAVRQLVSRARASLRVAATAVTPWPAAVWLAGVGGPQAADTATRVGELVGGVGAGTLFGGGALKAGAVVAAAGAVAVGVPQVNHVVRERPRPAPAQAATRTTTATPAPAGTQGPATTFASAPATSPAGSTTTSRSSAGDDRDPGRADAGRGNDTREDRPGRGEDRGPRGAVPGGPDDRSSGDDDERDGAESQGVHDPPRDRRGRHGRDDGDRRGQSEDQDDHGGGEDRADAPEPAEPPEGPERPEQREDGSGSSGSSGSGSGSDGHDAPESPESDRSHDSDEQREPSVAPTP